METTTKWRLQGKTPLHGSEGPRELCKPDRTPALEVKEPSNPSGRRCLPRNTAASSFHALALDQTILVPYSRLKSSYRSGPLRESQSN